MALQLGALRGALVEAGASPATSARASEEIASYESKLSSMDSHLTLLTWMAGTSVVMSLTVLGTVFALWSKLADISSQLAQIAHSIH
jgi:hypothetical protein